jgi:hypothetical protein
MVDDIVDSDPKRLQYGYNNIQSGGKRKKEKQHMLQDALPRV